MKSCKTLALWLCALTLIACKREPDRMNGIPAAPFACHDDRGLITCISGGRAFACIQAHGASEPGFGRVFECAPISPTPRAEASE